MFNMQTAFNCGQMATEKLYKNIESVALCLLK